jgi:hypothetical protein
MGQISLVQFVSINAEQRTPPANDLNIRRSIDPRRTYRLGRACGVPALNI